MTEGAPIERVGVVGSGLMGTGIAEVCARNGVDVLVAAPRAGSVERGRQRLLASLDKAVARGRLTGAERELALERVAFTADLDALGDRHLVIECIKEDQGAKTHLLGLLDKILGDPGAVLASNTSSIPIMRLARATERPARVVGTHFFSPVPVLPLVELTASLRTDPAVCDRVEAFLTGTLGKEVIRTQDRSGFVVNALLIPYILSAVRMVESGFASAEVVDRAMRSGCSHPMGPLQLADLIGLDIVLSVSEALYAEFREPQFVPPPLLARMVESDMLGRKAGEGFYDYR